MAHATAKTIAGLLKPSDDAGRGMPLLRRLGSAAPGDNLSWNWDPISQASEDWPELQQMVAHRMRGRASRSCQ